MKQSLLYSFFLILFLSTSIQAQCVREASFTNGDDYSATGKASIEFYRNGTNKLKISADFSTTGGPDLMVYLSKSSRVNTPQGNLISDAVNIGKLKTANGASEYTIPDSISLEEYDYVVIHCQQFNHHWVHVSLGEKSGADCQALSNEIIEFTNLEVYPNPSNNYINLDSSESIDKVTVLNNLGQVLITIKKPKEKINLSSLQEGIYIVVLENHSKNIRSVRKINLN